MHITTAVERYEPILSEVEQTTLLGFLAGYRAFTRAAYALDLRQFTAWCLQHDHHLFDVRRVDIEGRYDRGRQSLDRHATCIVATFAAGAFC